MNLYGCIKLPIFVTPPEGHFPRDSLGREYMLQLAPKHRLIVSMLYRREFARAVSSTPAFDAFAIANTAITRSSRSTFTSKNML